MSPNPQKVKVISEMQKPTSKTDLQCFLGMAAYLSKFIPNLSDKTKLRKLILKETVWDFSKIHGRKIDELKSTISSCAALKFFNPKLQTKIICDASKFGVGATREQKFHDNCEPIAFASQTLTPTEIKGTEATCVEIASDMKKFFKLKDMLNFSFLSPINRP